MPRSLTSSAVRHSVKYKSDDYIGRCRSSLQKPEPRVDQVGAVTSPAVQCERATGVTEAFIAYEDFLTYKPGVYRHQTGSALGGHAVEVIGYGTENGEDYWLVKNSWNKSWGAEGLFKFAKGVDECGIEDQPVAGDA